MNQIDPPANGAQPQPPRPEFLRSRSSQVLLSVIFCDLLILAAYVWLISAGYWTTWPGRTHYYDQLASAFAQGQLYLSVHPNPALLALPDPYDPAARASASVPFQLDYSLYHGKFYLYFGPVPALLLAVAKFFSPNRIADADLVLAFSSATFLVESLLIAAIWRRYFADRPVWSVAVLVIMAGWTCPFIWMLRDPDIHPAAITAGAFFFLAGFYAAFSALAGPAVSKWKMAVAGLLWTAAIGTRSTQLLPVAFMSAWILAGLLLLPGRVHRSFQQAWPALLALALPLGLGLAALAWYDWARFGSVFETGFSYAITAQDLRSNIKYLFSPNYVVQNLLIFLFNPPKLVAHFPYLKPLAGPQNSVLAFLQLSPLYFTQTSTGLLYASPLTVLALFPLIRIGQRRPNSSAGGDGSDLTWLTVALAGSFLSALAMLTAFFWIAERYVADFIPCLLLLSSIGFWQIDRALTARPRLRTACRVLAVGLIIISIPVNLLLGLASNQLRFIAANPLLWNQMSSFFRQFLP